MTSSSQSPDNQASTPPTDTDVIVVGSGFGGSVTALRLTEKGYRVTVVEAGRRFEDSDFAKTSWRLNKFVWAPKFGLFGIQRLHILRDVLVMAGAGVGGGSLNYANTLYKPSEPFFTDPQWEHITDWDEELSRSTTRAADARRRHQPHHTHSDTVIKEVARTWGRRTRSPTPVVFFGEKTGGRGKRETVRPVLRRRRPGPHRLHRVRRVHDRLPHVFKNTLVKNYPVWPNVPGPAYWTAPPSPTCVSAATARGRSPSSAPEPGPSAASGPAP